MFDSFGSSTSAVDRVDPQELQDRRLQRQLLHELEFLRQVFEASRHFRCSAFGSPRGPDVMELYRVTGDAATTEGVTIGIP